MSRKGKRKSKKSKLEEKSPKKKNLTVIILVLVIAALVAVGVGLKLSSKKSSDKTVSAAVDDSSLRRGETRPTLSPAQFSYPKVAEAYQIAKDIPHVLDSVFCYCYCSEKPFYHKSLLSCYVDMHAAG